MQGSLEACGFALALRSGLSAQQRAGRIGTAIPLELAFLAAEDLTPELMGGVSARAERRFGRLLGLLTEGKITEEPYYRALAIHLGCEYYNGDPPLANSFDAVKGLRCGVGALEPRSARPRIVVAPQAQLVPRLIEATRLGANTFRLVCIGFATALCKSNTCISRRRTFRCRSRSSSRQPHCKGRDGWSSDRSVAPLRYYILPRPLRF